MGNDPLKEYIYIYMYIISALVGGFYHLETYEFVSWDDDIPNIWNDKKCLKPPARKGDQ